jgi:S1-C subfamily serine protease
MEDALRSAAPPTQSVDACVPTRSMGTRNLLSSFCILHFTFFILHCLPCPSVHASILDAIDRVQPKMVKLYGAGGFRGMEAYQSGILVSPTGHILTVYSHVLDTDYLTAVLADGRKFEAKLLGADPRLEAALLKIDAAGLPYFDLAQAARLQAGARVLAVSNIFGVASGNEPASVQKGTVSVVTKLEARRGVFETPYHGPVYVLDVTTNNSGAAGGALVSRRGELAGMLGKELRNSLNNTWLNYAIPIEELRRSVDEIRAGKFVAQRPGESPKRPERPLDPALLGIVLIPDVVERTPPFVDHVRPGSPAAAAGIRPDDLVLLVGDRLVQSCKGLVSELESTDFDDPVKLTLLRGQELIEVSLRASSDVKLPRKGQP